MTHRDDAIELMNRLRVHCTDDLTAQRLIRDLRAAFEMACPPPQTERVLECSWCSAELSTGRVYELAIDVNGHPECPSCGDRNNLRVRGGR